MATGHSQTFHYWKAIIKDDPTTKYVTGGVVNRGTAFEGEPTIEDTDWEGHDGSKSILMSKDRTSASAEPEWEQPFMFGEGIEDYCYLLLGSNKTPTSNVEVTPPSGGATIQVYNWEFYQNLTNVTALPYATIVNGYSANSNDAVVYDNARASEFEFNFDKDGANLKLKWGSNAPIINQPNPSLDILSELSRLGIGGFELYLADYGTGLRNLYKTGSATLENYHYGCVVSCENKFSTNLQDSLCIGGTFGKNEKDEGDFTNDGSLEVLWSDAAAQNIIDKWYTGKANGTDVTDESYFAELLLVGKSRLLGTTSDNKEVYETFMMTLPKIEITKAWSQQSGKETKTISTEYCLVANGQTSPVYIDITSKLSALHIGTPIT